ncbi:MAG: tol-pal system protein YbgF [Rubrivivax sp.]|nr:tol-pal system protein YbgF [Rubrivivax sp.]
MTTATRALALALVLACGCGAAQAQLIKDTEARKAIADLDAQFKAGAADIEARAAARKAETDQLAEQLAQLRKSIAEIGAEIGKLQEEAVRMRAGRAETLNRVAGLRSQLDEEQKSFTARLAALEPVTVSTEAGDFLLAPEEARQHDEAMQLMKAADYERAAAALGGFARRFPGSEVLPSVRFWLGNAQYALKNFNEALGVFRAMVASAPEHPRAPAAGLAIANCHVELKNLPAARKALEDVMRQYPNSEAAATAKERLALLRG